MLSVEQRDLLNLMQSSIGRAAGFKPVLCRKRNDGAHVAIAGMPAGLMIVGPKGFICPVCPFRKPVSAKPADLERAQDSIEFVPLTRETLALTRELLVELEGLAAGAVPRVAPLIRSLESFAKRVEKELCKPKYGGPIIDSIPLNFLLALHNLDEHGAVRREIIEWLDQERATNPRNHWMDSIEVLPNGHLAYNRQLFELAAWRGKQETYFNSATESFERVLKALEAVSRNHASEDRVLGELPDVERLFPMRELQPDVKRLKSMAPQLQQIMEALGGRSLADVSAVLHGAIPQLAEPLRLAQSIPTADD
ncbi:hypothetical protein ACRCPS_17665 [Pseudomonas aeruginosa]